LCPISVRLPLRCLCNVILQLRHCAANIGGGCFDVVSCRRAHVRMTEDSLNHNIRNTQAIQIAPKATPGSVPAVPLGNVAVTPIFVIRLLVS
jgi:hypothetical protein